jgi:AAA domain
MNSIANEPEGGSGKTPSNNHLPGDINDTKPWRDEAAWKPPTTPEGNPDWENMANARPLRDPNLGFYVNKEEKQADEQRTSKLVEDMRRTEEAKLATAQLKAGVALPPRQQTDQSAIVLEWAMSKSIAAIKLEYLVDPFLPARCVVGFFGRGSTAKSSFLGTMAARISEDYSTLWISVEELKGWIAQRHVRSGGAEGTLAVFSHSAVSSDAQGRVTGSTFDIYRDLNGAILAATEDAQNHYTPPRPLRLVVLDTALGLTTWGKGESANDDGAVKRLLSHLQALAEKHDVCIAIIGHSNKGKHDYFADTVAGSSAWTNSPRLSFVHATDRREEHTFVMRVAKTNLSSFFAVAYRTEPVLTLHQHEDGHASVLCKVELEPVVWGGDASTDLFEAATRKPDEQSSTAMSKRQGVVTNAIQTLVEAVMATQPEQHVTREDVAEKLGHKISRREWVKVDNHLNLHPTVVIERGDKNRLIYRRRT